MDSREDMVQSLESLVFVVDEDGTLVIETRLNNTQFVIEYMDEQGRKKYYSDTRSLIDYPNLYQYEGRL